MNTPQSTSSICRLHAIAMKNWRIFAIMLAGAVAVMATTAMLIAIRIVAIAISSFGIGIVVMFYAPFRMVSMLLFLPCYSIGSAVLNASNWINSRGDGIVDNAK